MLSVRDTAKGNAILTQAVAYLQPSAPVYSALAPAIGSKGGTELTITGDYFPKDYTGRLRKNNNHDICEEVVYVSKTELKCVTLVKNISQTETKLYSSSRVTTSCATCLYETDNTLDSEVTALSSSYTGTTLHVTLDGTNFPQTGGATATVTIAGKAATSATIASAI